MMAERVELQPAVQAAEHPKIDSTLLHQIRLMHPTSLHLLGEYTVHTEYCRNHALAVVGYMAFEHGRKTEK